MHMAEDEMHKRWCKSRPLMKSILSFDRLSHTVEKSPRDDATHKLAFRWENKNATGGCNSHGHHGDEMLPLEGVDYSEEYCRHAMA